MRRDRLSRKNQKLSQRTRSRRNQTRRKSNKRKRNKRKRNTKRDIRRIRDRKLYRKNTKRRTKRSKRNQRNKRNKMKKTMRRGGSPPPQATDPWKNAKSAAYTPGGRRIRTRRAQALVDEVREEDTLRRAGSYPRRVVKPTVEGAADMQARHQQAHAQNQALQAEQLAEQAASRAAQEEQRAAQAAVRAEQAPLVVGMPDSDSVQAVLAPPPVVGMPESSQAQIPWVGEAMGNLEREIAALRH